MAMGYTLKTIFAFFLLALGLWCSFAIYFINLENEFLGKTLSTIFLVFWLLVFVFSKKRFVVSIFYLVAVMLFITWWSIIPASNDRDWMQGHDQIPHASYDNDNLTIYNFRNFKHLSIDDAESNYLTTTYDLNDLEGVDLVLSYWQDRVLFAHSMLVFRFNNAENIVLSVEARREKGEPWTIPRGIFRQYEEIYVLGTETDLIKLRTNIRSEDVFLYPTKLSKTASKELLKNAVNKINSLYEKPEYYNTFLYNCTSSLFEIALKPERYKLSNPELFFNGLSDRFLYNQGDLIGEGSYWKFKFDHYITSVAKNSSLEEVYSSAIRKNIAYE